METRSEDIFILVKYFILCQVKNNNNSFETVLENQITFDPGLILNLYDEGGKWWSENKDLNENLVHVQNRFQLILLLNDIVCKIIGIIHEYEVKFSKRNFNIFNIAKRKK